jgi:chloramphenicol-sensitive protein RarD
MIAAISAYFLWGISPLYWKLLASIPLDEVLAHRVLWSFVFIFAWVICKKNWTWLEQVRKRPQILGALVVAAALLFSNWYMYNWAINNSFVVEASLGYFINPLVNFLLALIVLKERPRRLQTVSILIAFLGVGVFAYSVGTLPWVSLGLAITFGVYGLIKKQIAVEAAPGMVLEVGVMLVPALALLGYLQAQQQLAFLHNDCSIDLLLIATGLATGAPLVLFAAAAKKMTLISMGILQFMSPSLQFLLGVFVYGESFTQEKLVGFLFIWIGLILFTYESLRFYNGNQLKRNSNHR